MKTQTQTIKDIEKEIERLLVDLDGYGYSRKETLEDLNKGFSTDVSEEVYFKWRDLTSKLQATKETAEAVKKEVLEIIDDDIIHPSGNLHKRLYEALKDKAGNKLIEEKQQWKH